MSVDVFDMIAHRVAAAASEKMEDRKTKIDPEAAMMRIAEAAERFYEAKKGPRFKIGDWVTPASDSRIFGHGAPHLVVDTRKTDYCFDPAREVGTPDYGCREDMLVLGFSHSDSICPYWVSSAEFIKWEPPT